MLLRSRRRASRTRDEFSTDSFERVVPEYRDVGPFRYWTVQQLPNFLLAAPVLAMSFAASYDYYTHRPRFVVAKTFPFLASSMPSLTPAEEEDDEKERSKKRRRRGRGAGGPFFSPALLPFVHLHTATTVLLSVSAHVQIVLRLCSANPVVWWYVADLVLAGRRGGDDEGAARREDCMGRDRDETATRRRRRSVWGQRWIVYTVVWGTVSIICWALFLPPA